MALPLAHVRSVHSPSRHVHYGGRLSRQRDDLDPKEQARLEQLLSLSPEVQTVYAKVNKHKTLKRVMFGRAGFALLRQRLLHDG